MSEYKPPQQSNASDRNSFVVDYFALGRPRDAGGYFHHQAAWTVVVNEHQEALLVCGHDLPDSTYWWQFTVGGGVEPGGTSHEAAVRKFLEEAGYRLRARVLTGPVLRRHATFDLHQLTCKQDEDSFFVWISSTLQFSRVFGTEVEKQVIDELKWWDLTEFEGAIACGTVVHPLNFVPLARGWLRGWNGETIEIFKGIALPKRQAFSKGLGVGLESTYA